MSKTIFIIMILLLSACSSNQISEYKNKLIAIKKDSDKGVTDLNQSNAKTWSFTGRYTMLIPKNRITYNLYLNVKNGKITGKRVIERGGQYYLSGNIDENNNFVINEFHSTDLKSKLYWQWRGKVLSSDHLDGEWSDPSGSVAISIVNSTLIENYVEHESIGTKGGHANNDELDVNTTLYQDSKEFTRSTSNVVKLSWEILNNPTGSAERIVNDEAYGKEINNAVDDMVKSSEKINKRIDGYSQKANNILNKFNKKD